jgi:anti-anti-sigma factor
MRARFETNVFHDAAGFVTVAVRGDIDLGSADKLNDCLHTCEAQNVMVDLTDVTFLDSYGMYVLVANATRLEADGYHLAIRGQNELIQRSLEVAGLLPYLTGPLEKHDH